jgi:hypothetical protein
VLAGLLADCERSTRLAAAQGPATPAAPATALLRFKLLLGDDKPAVLSACVEGALALARDAHIHSAEAPGAHRRAGSPPWRWQRA